MGTATYTHLPTDDLVRQVIATLSSRRTTAHNEYERLTAELSAKTNASGKHRSRIAGQKSQAWSAYQRADRALRELSTLCNRANPEETESEFRTWLIDQLNRG